MSEFARLRLHGGRFEHRVLFVDALSELHAYYALLFETAKYIFKRENPHRERAPKNYDQRFGLYLSTIFEGNSVTPVLERPDPTAQPLLQPQQDEFEQARDLVNTVISEQATDAFPNDLLYLFNRFGRTLRPSEAIGIQAPSRNEEIAYDNQTRQRLVKRGGENYYDYGLFIGYVSEINTEERKFVLITKDGFHFQGHYASAAFSVLNKAFADPPEEGRQIRVEADVEFSPEGRPLRTVDEVDDVVIVGSHSWAERRLEELEQLDEGWSIEGQGSQLDHYVVQTTRDLLEVLERNRMPQPRLGPDPEGGLTAEWTTADRKLIVDILGQESMNVALFDIDNQSIDVDEESVGFSRIVSLVGRIMESE